ncbi:hypothetical protein TNCV_3224051 [Trichonephila clavipes]|nr:hypothetical protein TNCV_3224051 [Trichonephila clavipes]
MSSQLSLCFNSQQDDTDGSQLLTSLYPENREVTSAVSTPISSFKVHFMISDKDQWRNSNTGYIQTEMILRLVTLEGVKYSTF